VVAGEHGEQAPAEDVLRTGQPGAQPHQTAGGRLGLLDGGLLHRGLLDLGGDRPARAHRLLDDQRWQLVVGDRRHGAGRCGGSRGSFQGGRARGGGRRQFPAAHLRHHQADGSGNQDDEQDQSGDHVFHAEILTDEPPLCGVARAVAASIPGDGGWGAPITSVEGSPMHHTPTAAR
jgi:hypothetical protein